MKKIIISVCAAMLSTSAAYAADFTDIDGHWAQNTINSLADAGYINGVGDGMFDPDGNVTRAQYLKMMMDTVGIEISDVRDGECLDASGDDWYAPYLQSALDKGLIPRQMITGYEVNVEPYTDENGNSAAKVTYLGAFSGNVAITREEAAFISMGAYQYTLNANTMQKLAEPSETKFTDADSIEQWAYSAVKLAADNGIITGMDDGRFAPLENTTRAQAAVIMERLLNMIG